MNRGEIWWADLDEPRGSEPGFRHPVVIVQADSFNQSRIGTVIVAVISSNVKLANAPGNIFLSHTDSKLPKDSVINISQIITLDKTYLTSNVSTLKPKLLSTLADSLRLILEL